MIKEEESPEPRIVTWRQTQLSANLLHASEDEPDSEVLRMCLQRAFASEVLSEEILQQAEKMLTENKQMQEKFIKILQQPDKVRNKGPLLLHTQGFETLERLSRAVISAAIASESYNIAVQMLHLTGQYYRVKESEESMELPSKGGVHTKATNTAVSMQEIRSKTEFLSSKLGNQKIFRTPAVWMQVLEKQLEDEIQSQSPSSFYGTEEVELESLRRNDILIYKAKCLLYEMKGVGMPYKQACSFLSMLKEKYAIDKHNSEGMEQKLRMIWINDKSKTAPSRSPVMELASCPKRIELGRRLLSDSPSPQSSFGSPTSASISPPSSPPVMTMSPFSTYKKRPVRRYSSQMLSPSAKRIDFSRSTSQHISARSSRSDSKPDHHRRGSSLQGTLNLDMVDLMLNPVVPLPPTSSDFNFLQRHRKYENQSSLRYHRRNSQQRSPVKRALVGSLLDSIRFLKQTGEEEAVMGGPITCISCFGTCLVAGDLNGRVNEYSTASNRLVNSFHDNAGPISAILCTGEAILAASTDAVVRIWQPTSTDSEVTQQKKGYIKMFNHSKTPTPKVFPGHEGPVQCLEQVSSHQSSMQLVVSGSSDKSICLWDTASTDTKIRFCGHQGSVTCLYASYHGNHLLSGSQDSTVRLWDMTESGSAVVNSAVSALRVFKGHSGPISCVKQLGRQSAVSASADRTIRFWDKRMRKSVAVLKGHTGPVTFFQDGGPDGTLLITGSADCTVRIWDMRHTSKGSIHICKEHTERVTSILRKKTRILSSSDDSFLCEWDLNSGSLIKTYQTHKRGISCMSVSEAAVITASFDASLRIWPRVNVEKTR